jgi:2-polyprenyl-3-methyl-5-hydroxy-6-metoxy-1,4-benzoquinol methylase
MSLWTRTSPLDAAQARQQETWSSALGSGQVQSFQLDVKTGKSLDVMGLKNLSLAGTREYSERLASRAMKLYGPGMPLIELASCTCCGSSLSDATECLRIFDVPYHRCQGCGHVMVTRRPAGEDLNFEESAEVSQTYVDPSTCEVRLSQVIAPKVGWMNEAYEKLRGRRPASLIDVGAGGGHFVEGARRAGVAASGFELSKTSRAFAKAAFGLDLRSDDFLSAQLTQVDVITMWGLLEYVQEPRRFVDRARAALMADTGMLVVEVPRFDALGTAAQAANPRKVARHMDPTTHINCFSDSSLATVLVGAGFAPVAVWYFGMDAYELLVQCALRGGDDAAFTTLADMIPVLQCALDSARCCDDIIVAAVPV